MFDVHVRKMNSVYVQKMKDFKIWKIKRGSQKLTSSFSFFLKPIFLLCAVYLFYVSVSIENSYA